MHDALADFGRSGKGQLADHGMTGERGAAPYLAVAGGGPARGSRRSRRRCPATAAGLHPLAVGHRPASRWSAIRGASASTARVGARLESSTRIGWDSILAASAGGRSPARRAATPAGPSPYAARSAGVPMKLRTRRHSWSPTGTGTCGRRRSPRRRRRGRGIRCTRCRPGGAGASGPPVAARTGTPAWRTRPSTAPAAGAGRTPGPPARCPRAGGRRGGRPCPRSRTSPW